MLPPSGASQLAPRVNPQRDVRRIRPDDAGAYVGTQRQHAASGARRALPGLLPFR